MSKNILIVDDSPSLRQVVGDTLTAAGYAVIAAEDGCDGLAKLDGRRIHLIISDVNMPNMDGIAFLKAVKGHPDYRFTPVVMLTTEGGEKKKLEGQAAGARAWLVKPFQPQQLVGTVARLVQA